MLSLDDVKKLNIPKTPGCYQYKNKDGKIIYVGKAANLASRVMSYWQKGASHTPAKSAMMREIAAVDWIEVESEIEALLLEANLIKKYQPSFNVVLRDDKRFLYIKVSTEDEIPGVFATRKIDKSGRYFGPFTGAFAVRQTLKVIRKIWPYCTERRVGEKICFYAQIGRCSGVCGGKYPLKDYREKVIRPIILFLEGKKGRIVRDIEKEIGNWKLEIGKLDEDSEGRLGLEEKVSHAKRQLINMRAVLDHANIIGVGEKYEADVVELAKVLTLARVPERIEGYDISNIFGREAVGSMVVFSGGEPDKSQYRKFKIRIGEGEANDVRMLAEVLERRFRHVARNMKHETGGGMNTLRSTAAHTRELAWREPDLIIVDGGKAQLNVAVRIIKKAGLDIPVIAISKGEGLRSAMAPDKIFFPGEKKPLELPLASPALHIIKRVRDEAHRFAIGYHRLLRKKSYYK